MVVELTDEKIDNILRINKKEHDKKFFAFMKKQQAKGLGCYFDPRTYYVCHTIYKEINEEDKDRVTVVVGGEGVGKSTLTSMLAVTVSDGMSMPFVCYEPQDFFNALKMAKKGDTLWLDEGALFLYSRQSSSKNSIDVVKLLTVIRQLNLHIIICIPNFFTIDSYVRQHRVSSVFAITKRGKFTYLPKKAVLFVSNACQRSKNIFQYPFYKSTPVWKGHYNNDFGTLNDLNKENYIARKHDNMTEFLESLEERFNDAEEAAKIDNSPQYINTRDAASRLGISVTTIKRRILDGSIKAIKIGNPEKAHYKIEKDYFEALLKNGCVV